MTTFDFEKEEEIEAALVEAIKKCPPPPGLKEAIRERLFGKHQELALPLRPSPVAASPRRLTPRRVASYAAGLVVIVSLLVMLAIWGRHVDLGTSVAFADVQEAIRHIETAIVVSDYPEKPWMNRRLLYRSDCEVVRQEWPNGEICLHDTKQGQELVLNLKKKTVRIQDRGRGVGLTSQFGGANPRELLDKLAQVEQTAVARLGERKIDGRKLVGFVLPRDSFTYDIHMLRHIWIDPQTRLPVRYELLPEDPSDLAAGFHQYTLTFTFNQPLDPSLFRLVTPAGYTEIGYYMPYLDRLPLPPKDERLASPAIVPGEGIGQARFGMSVKQVIEVLGRPDDASYFWDPTPEETRQLDEIHQRARKEADEKGLKGTEKSQFINQAMNRLKITKRAPSGSSLDYISRGFCLYVHNDQGLARIFCFGEQSGTRLFTGKRPFTGKTSKGIGMGASAQEIEKAYGPPFAKDESLLDGVRRAGLYYKSQNMLFDLRDGLLWELSIQKSPVPKPGTEKPEPIEKGGEH